MTAKYKNRHYTGDIILKYNIFYGNIQEIAFYTISEHLRKHKKLFLHFANEVII